MIIPPDHTPRCTICTDPIIQGRTVVALVGTETQVLCWGCHQDTARREWEHD